MKATSSTPRTRELAAGLREAREARRLGLRQFARLLGIAPQLLSLWEKGLRLPTVTDVALILGYLQVSNEQREYLLDLARSAREPDWITGSSRAYGTSFQAFSRFEKAATRLVNWETNVVPGLLQTADYARAIFESASLTIDQVDSRVATRMQRQKRLTGRNPVTLQAMFDERILTNMVGNEDIMSDQMDHLLTISRLPHVSIRILAPTPSYHPGRAGAFMIMEYEEVPPIVLVEHYRCTFFLSDAEKVTSFRQLAKVVGEAAMSEESSRERIAEAAR
ncbi:helix-turn-helix domain-containing protein [Amycolatopsis sp. cmx-4-68]|uniref:helix-turn-helix domain-containing protein n=1 Tax=Amycolatopsis sp. cmx-4-68 TaxID=2790938 RepID=UPI0039780AD7